MDENFFIQYYKWISNIVLYGDFGFAFELNRPVGDLIWERLFLTFVVSTGSLFFIWIVAFPIGVFSALKQYSFADYALTVLAFIGVAIPNFLIALILMYVSIKYFGVSAGGLFSAEMADASWSWAKVWDLLAHLWVPILVLAAAGTGALARMTRANVLDELHKQYVVAARARGLKEGKVIRKYPVRMALNFFVSSQNNILVQLISGAVVVSIVLSLPTVGPLLMRALVSQDMYLAGGFLLMLSVLNMVSTLLSDIALAFLDPRIRFGGR